MRLPILHGPNGRAMADHFLGQVLVVQPDIAFERGFEVVAAAEVVCTQDLRNAAVEALDHAVGLRPAWRGEAVVDSELGTALIKAVRSSGLALAVGGEAVGEFLGVVGQGRVDLERCVLVQRLEKALGRSAALVGHELHVDPARGAVNGHKGIAPLVLVAHLRQILYIDVHEARLIGLEGLARACLGIRFLRQLGDAVAPQHAVQRRAAHLRGDELARHRQQIVQWQAQGRPQIQHQRFLPVVEGLGEPVRRMTAVRRRVTAPPLHNRVPGLTKAHRQLVNGTFGFPNRWRGRRVLMQAQQHPESFSHGAKTPTKTSRPISSGRLL